METETGAAGRGRPRVPAFVQHGLKFALGGAAVWALIHTGGLKPALVARALIDHPWLCVCALLAYLLVVMVPAWLRWLLLLRLAGIDAPASRVFSLNMIGILFNSLVPGGTGGDLIKGYYLYKEHDDGEKSLALTSIAVDRLIGLYSLLCVAMLMTWVNYGLWKDTPSLRFNSLFYAGVFLIATVAIAFFFSPWSARFLAHPRLHKVPGGRLLKSLGESLLVYRGRPAGLLAALGVGMVVDFGLVLVYYFSALSLDLRLPLAVHGFVVPTLTIINGIPISPSGLGVGEAAGALIYSNLGVTVGGGEILALVHICYLAASLAGAPFYLLYRVRAKQTHPAT